MPKRRVVRHEVIQPLEESYRLIPLTQGKNAIVDAEDFEWLNQWNWYAIRPRNIWYAVRHDRRSKPQKAIYMHALICGFDNPDHKDRDGLNNRRSNLRKCTRSDQAYNTKKLANNTSGFMGVSWDRQSGKWKAQIMSDSRHIALGRFLSKEEAARAYDKAARIYHGEFAHINLP